MAFAETRSLTYGFVFDAVRWQIVTLPAVRALAVVSAAPANASTASMKPSCFIASPSDCGDRYYAGVRGPD